jgi:hypothetical protein
VALFTQFYWQIEVYSREYQCLQQETVYWPKNKPRKKKAEGKKI